MSVIGTLEEKNNVKRMLAIVNVFLVQLSTNRLYFGILQGADTFKAKVNIEVQLASELAIAAIEKNGGVVTTAFYDPRSLGTLVLQSFSFLPLCPLLAAI